MSIEAISWALKQPIKDAASTLLLITMANYADEENFCTASYKILMSMGRIASRSTLSKRLSLLEDQGFISRFPQPNRHGGSEASIYRLMVLSDNFVPPQPVPKPTPKVKPAPEAIQYPFPLNVEAWELWTSYKVEQFKDRYKSPRSELIACKKLIELANGDNDTQQGIVEQSIANTWKGLFALQEQRNGGQNQADWRAGLAEVFAEEAAPESESEIIIDADYLAPTTPRRSLTGKALPRPCVVSPGLSDDQGQEGDSSGIWPGDYPEADY